MKKIIIFFVLIMSMSTVAYGESGMRSSFNINDDYFDAQGYTKPIPIMPRTKIIKRAPVPTATPQPESEGLFKKISSFLSGNKNNPAQKRTPPKQLPIYSGPSSYDFSRMSARELKKFIDESPKKIYELKEINSYEGREQVLHLHRALQEAERRQAIMGKKLRQLDTW